MNLKDRVDILLETKLITEEVYKLLLEIIKKLEDEYDIKLTEENGGMFITHLSAAITRIKKGEPINELDEAIINEIKADESYFKAKMITDNIKRICELEFPLGEEIFIITHICSILNN